MNALDKSAQFTFQLKLANLDQLVNVMANWKTISKSPVFQISKPLTIDVAKDQVEDEVFKRHEDGIDGKTVSLYYGLWSSPSGPQRQLIKTIFIGSGLSTSLEST